MAKYKKQFKIAIPLSLFNNLERSIKTDQPKFEFEIESFYGILYDIASKMVNHDDFMVPLSSKILQNKYGPTYHLLLSYLIENKIIIENRQFFKNHCRLYSLSKPSKESKKMATVFINLNSRYGRYVKRRHNDEQKKSKFNTEHIKMLRKEFYNLKFDVELAIEELNSNKENMSSEQYTATYSAIICLEKGNSNQRFFSRNSTNDRIDSNITSLKSYFKKFINYSVNQCQLDLKNSQPVLFNIVLNNVIDFIHPDVSIKPDTSALFYSNEVLKHLVTQCSKRFATNQKRVGLLKQEMENYRLHTSTGKWYEHLSDVYNEFYQTKYFDREKAKSMWMAIAYSSNYSKNYNVVKKAFEAKYPEIGKIIRIFKNKNYSDFAIILQKIESHIFIDQISPQLIKNNIVPITIHDSLIVQEHQKTETQRIMNEVLNDNLGFLPVIEIEHLKDLKLKTKQTPLNIASEVYQLQLARSARLLLAKKQNK